MSDGMRRELMYLSSYATNRYFIPNWGNDGTYASEEIQDNRAATHTANHESLATLHFPVVSLVLDKEDVSK